MGDATGRNLIHIWYTGQKSTPEDPLWYWMSERQSIWAQKVAGAPKPWTEDPILRKYRFCNVYRELDTVTIWINENIRTPFADHPHLWFMLAIARTINWPPTLRELMSTEGAWPLNELSFSPGIMTKVLQARKDRGEKVYTGAYMIRAESNPTKPWYNWSKQEYIARIVLGRLWDDRRAIQPLVESAGEMEIVWTTISKRSGYIGWGPFMTYEWVTDLRWTRYLRYAADKLTWACAGPGALRGLRRLRGNDGRLEAGSISQAKALERMQELLKMAPKKLPPYFKGLEIRDIEHSLCEVDKYLRVYHGEGKPRALYNGLA